MSTEKKEKIVSYWTDNDNLFVNSGQGKSPCCYFHKTFKFTQHKFDEMRFKFL